MPFFADPAWATPFPNGKAQFDPMRVDDREETGFSLGKRSSTSQKVCGMMSPVVMGVLLLDLATSEDTP